MASVDPNKSKDPFYTQVENSYLQINDLKFLVPPEKIVIIKKEFSQDVATLRSQTPKVISSGRRMVTMMVELIFATGYNARSNSYEEISPWINSQLAPLLIQTRKCPFVYIENEKLRREIIGSFDQDVTLAATIKNITMSSQVRDSEMLRVSITMDVFNYTPYTPDFKFKRLTPAGRAVPVTQPGPLFEEFYKSGTYANGRFINAIKNFNGSGCEIIYKQYAEISMENPKESLLQFIQDTSDSDEEAAIQAEIGRDPVNPKVPVRDLSDLAVLQREALINSGNYVTKLSDDQLFKALEKAGWQKDDVQWKIQPGHVLVYRYKIFRINHNQNTDLNSGKMIIEAASAGLETHTPNIVLQSHSIPTAQFLGASSGNISMQIFANAETTDEGEPVGTSLELMELSKAIEEINLDAILYHRQSFNDSIFLSHPLASLCKYKQYSNGNDNKGTLVYDPKTRTTTRVDLNQYLACSVEDMSSETVDGHPFCSRVTINFVEDYVSQDSNVKAQSVGKGESAYKTFKSMILKLGERWGIQNVAQEKNTTFTTAPEGPRAGAIGLRYSRDNVTPQNFITTDVPLGAGGPDGSDTEERIARDLVRALNVSSSLDYSSLPGGSADFPFTSLAEAMNHQFTITIRKGVLKNILFEQTGTSSTTPFTYEEFTRIGERIIGLAINGQPAGNPYGEFVQFFNQLMEVPTESTYPDMMLPDSFPQPDHAWFNLTDYRNSRERLEKLTRRVFDSRRLIGIESAKVRDPKSLPEEFKAKNFIPTQWGPAPAANPMVTASEKYKDGIGVAQAPLDPAQQGYLIGRSVEEWQDLTYTMRRSMPTFKIYFKEDLPETEDGILEANPVWRNLSDVYDLNGIIDVRLSKKQDNPADILVIRMTNSRQDFMNKYYSVRNLTNKQVLAESRAKRDLKNATTPQAAQKAYRALHSRGDSKVLREGTRVELRMGYDNDPNKLSIEFMGRIMSANGTDIIEIVCQGDGIELVQDVKGVGGKEKELDTTTGKAIAEFLERQPELQSFGTFGNNTSWFGDQILAVNWGGRSGLENVFAPTLYSGWENFGESLKYSQWAYGAAAAVGLFSGGLAAPISAGLATLGTILFAGGLVVDTLKAAKFMLYGVPFKVYEQTVWEVLQEMTMRHPGVICAVVPFGHRSTIFFGYPDQLYFHRPATYSEKVKMKYGDSANRFTKTTRRDAFKNKQGDRVFGAHDFSPEDFNDLRKAAGSGGQAYKSSTDLYSSSGYLLDDIPLQPGQNNPGEIGRLAMKPFINYHVVTSMHDIVFNEIQVTSDDVYNAVRVLHPDDRGIGSADKNHDGSAGFEDYVQTNTIEADDDLIRSFVKLQTLVFHNASNHPLEDMPERYAINALAKNLENIYSGKLTILGRPQVKPHDIVFIEDFYSGISGPVKVGAVTHVLSYKTGWITEIHPKLVVSHYSSTLIDQVRAMKEVAKTVALQNMSTFQTGYIGAQRTPEDFGKQVKEKINAGLRSAISTGVRAKIINSGLATAVKSYQQTYKSAFKAENAKALSNIARSRALTGGVTGLASTADDFAKARKIAKSKIPKAKIGMNSARAGAKFFIALWGIEYALGTYIQWSKTRQPVAFQPLMRGDSPWVMGLWGFLNNSEEQAMGRVVGKLANQAINVIEAIEKRMGGDGIVFDDDASEAAQRFAERAFGKTKSGAEGVLNAITSPIDTFQALTGDSGTPVGERGNNAFIVPPNNN